MAISREHSKKSPSQNPVSFYQSKQQGGATGKAGAVVPDKLTSGEQREQVMGKKDLSK